MARASLSDFVMLEELSKGSYGVVFKAMRKGEVATLRSRRFSTAGLRMQRSSSTWEIPV